MTSANSDAGPALCRFQELLTELFQFNSADLDFGIYRIMNHKREAIHRFIDEKLPAAVSDALASGPLARQVQSSTALETVARQVRDTLGPDAIDERGTLDAQWHSIPLGQTYLDAQSQAAGDSRGPAAVEADIYNHLYNFFRRYYQDGDFISKRRYSRKHRYAIPYNGEEVYLHWANSDQYYVKTDAHFRNYDWNAPDGVAIRFRLDNANVEQNNIKGERRFFLPLTDHVRWDNDARAVTIPFEYRPLNTSEKAAYKSRNTQENIIAHAVSTIPHTLAHAATAIAALTGERRRNSKNEPVTRLEHHLRRYTARNNADFFIHQDLAGFLNRELDFYLKNEVLNLDDLTIAGQDLADHWFQILRLVKSVGSQIIAFLAQTEDFQKALWEKRKFVTATHYGVTLRNVDAAFYPDLIANDAQWDEWQALHSIDGNDRSAAFLRSHPTLMLDTRHFDAAFADRLLASFDDLDGMTDGVLVHGDNWQALNLMAEKYAGKVKCIYIDPPYNTKMAPILYKNEYRHSTWMSLVAQGIILAEQYMPNDGVLSVAIDDEEVCNLKGLLDHTLGADAYAGTVIVQSNPGGRDINTHLAISHDYCLFYAKPEQQEMLLPRDGATLTYNEAPFRRTGGLSSPLERENSEFTFYYDPNDLKILGIGGKRTAPYPDTYQPTVIHCWNEMTDSVSDVNPSAFFERYPTLATIVPQFTNGGRGVWRWSDRPKILTAVKRGDIFLKKNNRGNVTVTLRTETRPTYKPKTIWDNSKYSATTHGTILLQNILGSKGDFSYPKSVWTVKDAVGASLYGFPEATVLDYFAGSGTTGHAVINLNREDGGRRKFILVEMGEYFDTVLLPRIKKAVFAPEWRDGKPRRAATPEEAERSPRIIKYHALESYEDALDSIEFDETDAQLCLEERFGDEYLLKYMLRWETKGSTTLLNAGELTRPFSYRLRVHSNGAQRERTIDLPETFNWLLGLNVRHRKAYCDDASRRYLVYRGETREHPGRRVAVIWRDTAGWTLDDFARDRDFVSEQELAGDADTVYVNGGASIPGATALEPLFKARMFAAVNG